MAKLRVTFEVDSSTMFDMLAAVKDGGAAIGQRVAGCLLTGDTSLADHIGMGMYGVVLVSSEKIEPKTES